MASSIAVYAGLPSGPIREGMLLPVNSGNATETFKKAFKILGMHYASRTGMEVVSLRVGSPFGPLYHSLAAQSSRICHAAAKGVPPHEEDEVGAFYMKGCATAIQLLQKANKLSHRVYNIGNDAPLNYREFTEVVKK